MNKVELVYARDCPNIVATRKALLMAFTKARLSPHWLEWDINDPDAPDYIHGYGSPTILINETDIMNCKPSDTSNSCRIYPDSEHKRQGAPPVKKILTALIKNKPSRNTNCVTRGAIRYYLAVVPSVFIALLPKLTCPACWPTYTAILSSLGIGFVNYSPYLLPFTIIFLTIAITALYYQAKKQKQFMPFIFGLVSSICILVGKFAFDNDPIMYSGVALLMASSFWNVKYTLAASSKVCTACESPTENNSPGGILL